MDATTGSRRKKVSAKFVDVTKKISEHIPILIHSLEVTKFIATQKKTAKLTANSPRKR